MTSSPPKAATLEVAEAALTGESLPVSKGTDPVEGHDTPLGDRTDMVYMNTNVTRGTGEFVVTAIGMETEVGHISGMLQTEEATKTPLTRHLERLTRQILYIAGVALVASIALNLSHGDTFKTVFTAAVAFAIAAVPTGLPAVVTTILSYGTQQLAAAGAIMKQLRSSCMATRPHRFASAVRRIGIVTFVRARSSRARRSLRGSAPIRRAASSR